MPGRTIAIGDIHGCAVSLRSLLVAIRPQPEDTIITLGDYVDRGPDSSGVIEQLLELKKQCRLISLRGNHEIMFENAWEMESYRALWIQSGGQFTIDSYGGLDRVPESHKQFVRECVSWHETDTDIFLHACYDPNKAIDRQTEATLFWQHLDFMLPGPHCSGKRVYLGHTPQRNGYVLDCGYLVCIDTYCFGGKWLTAYDVAARTSWQADRMGRVRTGY